MAEAVQQSFFDRALTNLSGAWRYVAASAARSGFRALPSRMILT